MISTADYFQFRYETSSNDLSESFIETVMESDCFEAGGRLYTARILEENFSAESSAFQITIPMKMATRLWICMGQMTSC